jgi:hypothetical protein
MSAPMSCSWPIGRGCAPSPRAGQMDLAYVRNLGADEVLDFRATRFEDVVRDVDAVMDLVGGEVQARSFAALNPGGALISAVSPPDQAIAATRGIRAAFFLVDVTTACLTRIVASIETGALCRRKLEMSLHAQSRNDTPIWQTLP